MIVVIGQPVLRRAGSEAAVAGSAGRIAVAAAGRGSTVQLIGKVGEDPDGDALVLALARADVGHVALLRDPTRATPRLVEPPDEADGAIEAALQAEPDVVAPVATLEPADPALRPALEPADIDLGLRYLTEFSVVVVATPIDAAVSAIVGAAAGWSSATLIVLTTDGSTPPGLTDDAIVLEAPSADPDGPFDRLVGELAAALDRGVPTDEAFRELVATAGWQPAEG